MIAAFRYVQFTTFSRLALGTEYTPAEWITPFKCSCSSPTERRSTAAMRDDLHYKSLFLVKNKGQLNAKSGPKAAYGNFAMRTKLSGRLEPK